MRLPQGQRIRVLLGDPPIDWETVRTAESRRAAAASRGEYPARVLMRKVLSKQRRALVVYGALHLWKQNLQGPNLIERVEQEGVRAFVVVAHPFANLEVIGVDPSRWSAGSLALTKGTLLATQVDGVLYLGPSSSRTTSRVSPSLCADQAYRAMRANRMTLVGLADAVDRLAAECAAVVSQDHPDFSGVWVPLENAPPPTPPPPPPVGRPPPPPPPRTISTTIAQTAAELKVERRVESGGRETVHTFVYRLDGTESLNQMGSLVFRVPGTGYRVRGSG